MLARHHGADVYFVSGEEIEGCFIGIPTRVRFPAPLPDRNSVLWLHAVVDAGGGLNLHHRNERERGTERVPLSPMEMVSERYKEDIGICWC